MHQIRKSRFEIQSLKKVVKTTRRDRELGHTVFCFSFQDFFTEWSCTTVRKTGLTQHCSNQVYN